MVSAAARGDLLGFGRSVISTIGLATSAPGGRNTGGPGLARQIGLAQREFIAAAAAHRAAGLAGDTARLASAREALGERVLELSAHDRTRAAGIARAMAGIDPIQSGARGWQTASDVVRLAQGIGSIASGVVTANPVKVAMGIFRSLSSAVQTGRGMTDRMNKGIDRG